MPEAAVQKSADATAHSVPFLPQSSFAGVQVTTPPRTKMQPPVTPIRPSPHKGHSSSGKSPAVSAEDAEGELYYDLPDPVDEENIGHGFSDLEDEYTIPTAHLSSNEIGLYNPDGVNGTVHSSGGSAKGKSTIKGYRALHGFDDPAKDDDEELYS